MYMGTWMWIWFWIWPTLWLHSNLLTNGHCSLFFFLLLPIIAQLWVWGLAFIFCFAFHFAANLATCMTPHCWRCCFLAAVGHFGIFFNWRPTCNWPMILQLRNALCRMSMIDYKSGMSRLLRSFHTFIFHIFFLMNFGCIACWTFCCGNGFVIYLAY